MNIKTYDDGSVFTGSHLAASIGLAVLIGLPVSYAVIKVSDWRERRIAKKNGWAYTPTK